MSSKSPYNKDWRDEWNGVNSDNYPQRATAQGEILGKRVAQIALALLDFIPGLDFEKSIIELEKSILKDADEHGIRLSFRLFKNYGNT